MNLRHFVILSFATAALAAEPTPVKLTPPKRADIHRWVTLPGTLKANQQARADHVPSEWMTDDSLLVERLGAPIAIVEGSPDNFKITTPEDFKLAEKMISSF